MNDIIFSLSRIILRVFDIRDLRLFIRTPKITFIFLKATLDANPLLSLSIYIRQTLQSAQSFRPCVCGHFDKKPLLGNQSVIVKPRYFYSRRCNIFDIFVVPIMLLVIYLANPRDILRSITHGRCQQHAKEQCASRFSLPEGG